MHTALDIINQLESKLEKSEDDLFRESNRFKTCKEELKAEIKLLKESIKKSNEKEKLEENISTMSNPVQTVNISKTSTEASTSLINSNPILNLGSDMHKIKPRPNLDIA